MSAENLVYNEINQLYDDHLPAWLDLYETAFPAHERFLISHILGAVKSKKERDTDHEQLLAVLDQESKLVGIVMILFLVEKKIALLWYLAVLAEERSKGYGAEIYQNIIRQLMALQYKALLFEVEIPEVEKTEQAARRIQFYRRQGARVLGGIRYSMSVGRHQPVTPMNIMVHPLQPMDAGGAYSLAKSYFEEAIQKTGPITLE